MSFKVCVIAILYLYLSIAYATIENEIVQFKDWIASLPDADHINIEPHWFGEQLGVGAISVRDLHFGDIYASLPPSAVISETTARANKELASMCDGIYVMDERQASMDCLALFMILEVLFNDNRTNFQRRAGDKSFWSPYIKLLPQNYDHLPTLFDDSDLAELQVCSPSLTMFTGKASHTRTTLEHARRILAVKFKEFTSLQKKYPHLFNPLITYDEYVWAIGVVTTRTIWYIEDGASHYSPHLVPLVDLVNCAQLNRLDAIHKTMMEDNKIVTRIKQDYAAGEQVFENYGQANSHYFALHGFSIEPNEFDCVSIPVENGEFCINLYRLEDLFEKYGDRELVAKQLIPLINNHLKNYETSLEQDEAILNSITSNDLHSRRKKESVKFRMTEKRLLASVLKKLYEIHQHSEL